MCETSGMDIYTAIRGRRSVTGLREDVPSRAVLDRIIQASIWAPNHHLTEPWRFHVLCGAARDEMGAMVAKRLTRDLDPDDPAYRSSYPISACPAPEVPRRDHGQSTGVGRSGDRPGGTTRPFAAPPRT